MATQDIITGACNCGEITVSFPRSSVPPAVSVCHCNSCRASSGSLFAVNMRVPTKDVVVQGKPKTYTVKADSGNTTTRHFCENCGSPIMSIITEHNELSIMKCGLFVKSGLDLPAPAREVYWERAEKWEKPFEGVELIN